MKCLVTGGAGFIGRWVVKELLDKNMEVTVIDDFSNGSEKNLEEFEDNSNLKQLIKGSIVDKNLIDPVFDSKFDACIHLAAQINVHESLVNPLKAFQVNVLGTYNILEKLKKNKTKLVLVGTCMVYDTVENTKPINENHKVKPTSPYAGSKLAAENLAESYYYAYKLPLVILRPFNVYGPFQKANMEGGVVSIFIKNKLSNQPLNVYGDGTQTRDLLYVEDCADFIVKAALSDKGNGQIINAGLGKDISINELALLICEDGSKIKHVPHHHPQSEIKKLLCDNTKAKRVLGWKPKVSLKEGIEKTEEWLIKYG